ncbi:MAG TPA: hypothetical protein VHP99_20255 [Pyrinomonadaceae bacterium]|jgi:hypothetical protein|nr:hypothetical protein [Pyrinomonadaceae bacterium]
MGNEPDKDDHEKPADDHKESAGEHPADDKDIDESNRGERPDNLRHRSDWFQKRHGGG